ncbi:MAG: CdvA-like protein, partial [Candidatus Brockarchaeota archaeon]|nr:CdvA-like protein [Candidatus Brockarchaeota archaeon]
MREGKEKVPKGLFSGKRDKLIGETLRDPYGRCLGTVVGFATDTKNQVSKISVEYGSGEFVEHGTEQLIIENGILILRPEWKVNAEELRRDMEISKRRMSALQNLYAAGKVSARTYQELSEEYGKVLKCQEEERARLMRMLEGRNGELSRQIALLERLLADAEVQHITGEISEGEFKIAASSLKSGLDRALQEKKDVEMDLESLQLLDVTVVPEKPPSPAPAAQKPAKETSGIFPQQPPFPQARAEAKQQPSNLDQFVTSWRPQPKQTAEKE